MCNSFQILKLIVQRIISGPGFDPITSEKSILKPSPGSSPSSMKKKTSIKLENGEVAALNHPGWEASI